MSERMMLQVEELLIQRGVAHHQVFVKTDGTDDDWPSAYAQYLQEKLNPTLGTSYTVSELVYHILKAEYERAELMPDADCPGYYARHFLMQSP